MHQLQSIELELLLAMFEIATIIPNTFCNSLEEADNTLNLAIDGNLWLMIFCTTKGLIWTGYTKLNKIGMIWKISTKYNRLE